MCRSDKQFISQIDAAIVVPLVLAAVIPFCIEVVLAMLCGMWQRSTRRRKDYTGKSFRLGRWLCCACQKCRCCVVQMNCYMCDRDARSAAAGTIATTLTDAELAAKITGKVSHPVQVRTKEWNSKHRGHYDAADDIIIQSMLEPIDLKGEFTKQCSLVMLTIMWTIVFRWAPLVIMLIVELRGKSDFVRLTKYARRPIPVRPNDSDATGGTLELRTRATNQPRHCCHRLGLTNGMHWNRASFLASLSDVRRVHPRGALVLHHHRSARSICNTLGREKLLAAE